MPPHSSSHQGCGSQTMGEDGFAGAGLSICIASQTWVLGCGLTTTASDAGGQGTNPGDVELRQEEEIWGLGRVGRGSDAIDNPGEDGGSRLYSSQ